MKIRYDRQGDTLDILISDEQIHHAEEYGQIIVNYDEKGRLVEVEMLSASKLIGEFVAEAMKAPKREVIELS